MTPVENPPALTLSSFFKKLEGKEFANYKGLLEASQNIWAENIAILPVEISARDLIQEAVRRGWILQEGKLIVVKVLDDKA